MTDHCRSRRSRCHQDRQSEALNDLRVEEHRLLVYVWRQWRFRLVLLPVKTAGRYQKSFTAMTRLLLLFFSSLALIGSGFIQHEHRRHELTLLARRVVALGSVQDFGTVAARAVLSHQAFSFTRRQGKRYGQ